MRWVLSREHVAWTFSLPLDWPDGTLVFARLQYLTSGLAGSNEKDWREIPVVSQITEAPRISLVRPGAH